MSDAAAARRGDTVLEIRGLRIEAATPSGWRQIVQGVDLHVNRGEVLGLVGESGAGKSTIGLAAMGYVRPGQRIADGEICFAETELTSLAPGELERMRGARIGYVAQSAAAAFNPSRRLIEQCVEAAIYHGRATRRVAEQRCTEWFSRLGLPDPEGIGRRYPHQVSGGQLQRAMLAMTMVCGPDLIVFDEPTTALDPTTQLTVVAAIKDVLNSREVAAIYISHDLPLVAQLADRIVVLRDGAVLEESATRTMVTNPRHAYTRALWLAHSQTRGEPLPGGNVLMEVRGLAVSYRAHNAVLHDVDITLRRGQTVAVVGESGSGKSTIARAIAGAVRWSAGSLEFDGRTLAPMFSRREAQTLRRIQLIHQASDTALNPRRRVRSILSRSLRLHEGLTGAACDARINELLAAVGLSPECLDRCPSGLSGGQKQRIAIARALAARPELIICDEVTSSLDPLVADELLSTLCRLQREHNASYLFITHDIGMARAIADEVIVLFQGRVVERGPSARVLASPAHEYTRQLLSAVRKRTTDLPAQCDSHSRTR